MAGRAARLLARVVAPTILVPTILLASATAYADARTEARNHYRKGMSAIVEGRFDEGIAELQVAYSLLPHPNVLYNIARAYTEAGELENAIAHYQRYLESGPADREEVQSIIASLEGRIRRQQAVIAAAAKPEGPTPGGAAPGVVAPGAAAAAGTPPGAPATAPNPAGPGTTTTPTPGPASPTELPPDAVAAQAAGKGALGVKTDDLFEESVVTASRSAQNPLDAPNSTSIVTEQDIRLSGLTKIPELLRRLAGIDISTQTGSQSEVSVRGFNQRQSNKTLVLVNGRSVYVDLLGSIYWAGLSIAVEDIERIEVVRGPGSSLYGADAFNGVINIITRAPGEGKSGVAGALGDHNAAHASAWTTGRVKDFAYRFSAGYDYQPRWSREFTDDRRDISYGYKDQNLSQRTFRADLRGVQRVGKDITIQLGGGAVYGDFDSLGQSVLNNVILEGFQATDITAQINASNLQFRAFWNRIGSRFANNAAYQGQTFYPGYAELNVVDSELQYMRKFTTGSIAHDLRVGLSYRFKGADFSFIPEFRSENHGAGFVHYEMKPLPALAIVGDYRLDYVPYLDRVIQSPRGAVLVHPTKKSTIRAGVATAFRKPTFLESYVGVPLQLPLNGAQIAGESVRPDDPTYKVQEERIFSAEVGYLNQESDLFVFDSALFYNNARDIIQLTPNRPLTLSGVESGFGPPPSDSALYRVGTIGFGNQCQYFDVVGAELGIRVFPVEGVDFYANYTLNAVSQNDSGCSAAQKALLVNDERTSVHKVNAGVQVRTRLGIDGSLDFHYVSPQTWAEQVADVKTQQIVYQAFPLSDYALLNMRVGYRFLSNRMEASVIATNLLGTEHREHPYGQLIGRRVMGMLTVSF